MKKLLVLSLILSYSISASSKGLNTLCEELSDCIAKESTLTGNQYLSDQKLKGKAFSTSGIKLNKENATNLLTIVLSANGYTRVKVSDKLYRIVSKRDIRYQATPMTKASFNHAPNIKANMDFNLLSYKLKSKYTANRIMRTLRPFMSRYGRVTFSHASGILFLQDAGLNVIRLYKVIKEMDVKLTKSEEKRIIHEMKRERRKQKKHPKDSSMGKK